MKKSRKSVKQLFFLLCSIFFFCFPSQANLDLVKAKIKFFSNGKLLKPMLDVEVADTILSRQKGLQNRMEKLSKNHGMLFIFEKPKQLDFWMKDTYIGLSIAFFDKNKKLINIVRKMKPQILGQMKPNLESYSSARAGRYAIEVNEDWFHNNGLFEKKDLSFQYFPLKNKK